MNDMWAPFKKEIELIIKNKKKLIVFVFGIIVLIAIWTNVFSPKDSKEYYIDMVKNMDSPIDGYNFEEFLNMSVEDSNSKIEWDYEENKQVVSVTIIENGIDSTRYYSVKNGSSNIEEVYADGSSVNDKLSNVIGEALDEKYSSSQFKNEEVSNQDLGDNKSEGLEESEDNYSYGTYTPNDLGKKYFGHIRIDTVKDISDTEKIQEMIIDMTFAGYLNTVGDSLNNYLDDIQFSNYQTEKGITIIIKGYSDEVGNDLMVSILATYEGDVYLTEIRQGKNNTMMDISTQLKIADDMFE